MTSSEKPPEVEPERPNPGLGAFLGELRKRKVFRVALTYMVVAWISIQVTSTLFQGFEIPMWAFRLIVLLFIIGFPIALIITWAFELTPEGIKTNTEAQQDNADSEDGPVTEVKQHWLTVFIAAAIPTLIFGALTLFLFLGDRKPDASGGNAIIHEASSSKSIAVLPFENRSKLEDDQYFTDGIHDDLLTQISRIRGLKTISRTSVMGYRNTTKNLKTIGEELEVGTILEGGVQRAGDKVRINVQLIDAVSDTHLWSDTYTRELTAGNIFDIQSEIANAVAEALHVILLPEDEYSKAFPTQNLEALDHYFRGIAGLVEATVDGANEAIEQFEKAITLDPSFAIAHARLAVALMNISSLDLEMPQGLEARAEHHTMKALEIDDELPEAYSALGFLNLIKGDYPAAEAAILRALELNPNDALTYSQYGSYLGNIKGDAEASARAYRKAYELDPNSVFASQNLSDSLLMMGRFKEALEIEMADLAKYPNHPAVHYSIGEIYEGRMNQRDEAIIHYRKALFLEPRLPSIPERLGFTYLGLGDNEEAMRWFKRALHLSEQAQFKAQLEVYMYKATGDIEKAIAMAKVHLAVNPNLNVAHWVLQDMDLENGHPERSRLRYAEAYPEMFDPSVDVSSTRVYLAKDIARVLLATGETKQARHLISSAAKALESTIVYQTTGAQAVQLWAVAGDEQKTLQAMAKYLDTGGSPYLLRIQDEVKPYLDRPGFAELIEAADNESRLQLERVRKMDANGELPPIPPLPDAD